MKKLYTLALSAAITFSALAAEKVVSSADARVMELRADKELLKAERTITPSSEMLKVPAKITAAELYGYYYWSYVDCIDYKSYTDFVQIGQIEDQTFNAGVLGLWGNNIVKANADLAAGTLTFSPYIMGELDATTSSGKVPVTAKLEICKLNPDGQTFSITNDPYVLKFDGSNGTIDEEMVLAIAAYAKSSGELVGYFFAGALNNLVKDSWTDLGMATFVDGYMPTVIMEKPKAATSQVLVQRNDLEPNYIRIVSAWTGAFKLAWPGMSPEEYESYELEINIADPTYVTVGVQDLGVSGTDKNGEKFTVATQSINTVNLYADGLNEEQIRDYFLKGEYKDMNITMEGNVITFAPNSLITRYSNEPNKIYTSEDAMVSTLTLPDGWNESGVEDVVVDSNAPVEYFNLQGVRVANPESGIYIRRQGSKATKVLVK